MSDNNTTLGKAKRDIYIISESDRINNTKRKKTEQENNIGKKYLKTLSVRSSDTNIGVSNQIFIMGDTIVKRVKVTNYLVKWKTAKFKLRAFWVQNDMHRGLRTTNTERIVLSYHS